MRSKGAAIINASPMEIDQVRTLLSRVEDRAGKDVVATGLVQNLSVTDGEIKMELSYDAAYGPTDRAGVEKAIRTALKVGGFDGKVTLIAVTKAAAIASPAGPAGGNVGGLVGLGRRGTQGPGGPPSGTVPHGPGPQAPPGPPQYGPGGRPINRQPAPGPSAKKEIPGVRHIVAVASGKGGVGKSTVASNLAVALARKGHKVGLLDNDVYGPSLPILFAIHEQPKVSPDRKLIPIEKYGVKLMSIGFLLDEGAPAIWRGPIVMQVTDQLFYDTAWGELDYLVLDLPPGTGDVQLTLAQKVPLTGALIVSTPQDISLADAERGLRMFNRVDVPVMGIVENMSYFACPKCHHESHIFSHGGAKQKAKELEVPFLGEIPIDLDTRLGGDLGKPVVVSNPDGPVGREFAALADRVIESCAKLAGSTIGDRVKAGLFKILN